MTDHGAGEITHCRASADESDQVCLDAEPNRPQSQTACGLARAAGNALSPPATVAPRFVRRADTTLASPFHRGRRCSETICFDLESKNGDAVRRRGSVVIVWRRRFPNAPGIVCLEVHADRVAACHLEGLERDRPRLTWCGSWPRGVAGVSTADLAREIRARRLVDTPCVAVLPPDRYMLRLVDAPDVQPTELAGAVRWIARDLIDFGVEGAAVDFFEIPREQRSDRGQRVYVVAAQASTIQEVVELTTQCKLRLQSIGVRELALADLSRRLATGAGGAALLHLDRKQGVIVTVHNGMLHLVRRLEARLGDLLTEKRAQKRAVAIFEPQEYEFEADPRPLVSEESEVLDALLLEVQRSLDYHETHLAQTPVANLWCAPLEDEVPDLLSALEKNLTVGVRSLDLNEVLDSDDLLPLREQARYVAAIGAGLGSAGGP